MPSPSKSKSKPQRPKRASSRDKVRSHRARLRAKGMRLIQIWVPDTRTPEFTAEAHRQSRLIANSPHAKEDQDFVDAISEIKF
jgi:hypothetical protein